MAFQDGWFVARKEQGTLLLAIVCSIWLLFSNDVSQIHTLRGWVFAGFGVFLDKVSVISRFDDLYEANRALRRRNAGLMIENCGLREAAIENARLRRLLHFKESSDLDLVPARIVGKEQVGLLSSIIIAAGRNDAIAKNMAVVTAEGLVGKVFSVGRTLSNVQLLLDRSYRVSAMIQRSRTLGILKMTSDSKLDFSEVAKRSDVQVGDLVVTSGLSLFYPSGLNIGHVSQVIDQRQEMFMTIRVDPVVDLSKLEEVFVVRDKDLDNTER